MKFIVTFLLILGVYMLLAGFILEELILGAAVSLVLSIVLVKTLNYEIDKTFPLKALRFSVLYLPLFVYKLILANLDIARRVLSPSLPLKPGIVKVNTALKGDLGKLTLANSITLTPGTLTLDVKNDALYVHTVDHTSKESISGDFETVLGGIFK